MQYGVEWTTWPIHFKTNRKKIILNGKVKNDCFFILNKQRFQFCGIVGFHFSSQHQTQLFSA